MPGPLTNGGRRAVSMEEALPLSQFHKHHPGTDLKLKITLLLSHPGSLPAMCARCALMILRQGRLLMYDQHPWVLLLQHLLSRRNRKKTCASRYRGEILHIHRQGPEFRWISFCNFGWCVILRGEKESHRLSKISKATQKDNQASWVWDSDMRIPSQAIRQVFFKPSFVGRFYGWRGCLPSQRLSQFPRPSKQFCLPSRGVYWPVHSLVMLVGLCMVVKFPCLPVCFLHPVGNT